MLANLFARETPLDFKVHWVLRLTCFFCFLGHGAFGPITKTGWIPYFEVVGITGAASLKLQPLVGVLDMLVAAAILFFPLRAVLVHMIIWTFWTALLRPLAGQGWFELLERGGNYGIPLALLYLSGVKVPAKQWFTEKLEVVKLNATNANTTAWILRISISLLLIGHGGFGAFQQKQMLMNHWASVGISDWLIDPHIWIVCVGWFEIILGIAILFTMHPALVIFILIYKLGTELMYVTAGDYMWEFVERWGDYGGPLALYYLYRFQND